MTIDPQIQALISLLDDNDREIFDHVSEKLYSMGPAVIDSLEDAYTTIPSPLMQERIEELIHRIQFDSVERDLIYWKENTPDDLLKGICVITRHRYPELQEEHIRKQISEMQKDIWISINTYLSPLEQMHVINQVLFNQYPIRALANDDTELHFAYINNLLELQKGNHFIIGLLYLILCRQLDMPVYGVRLQTHFILTRTKEYIADFEDQEQIKKDILFYINPYNKGLAFSDHEIHTYIKKLNLEADEKYFMPATNKQVLAEYVQYLAALYKKPNDEWKRKDLERLHDILTEE